MNTHEQKKLSESLLQACKAAGIEEPKYFAQDANGNVFHYSQSKPKPQKHCEEWDSLDQFFKQVNHPPYADDWQDSLLEFREYALIRTCDKCQAITAIDMVGSDANEKELQCEGETVFRVSKEEAHGAVIKLCKCACGVENFNITKSAAMAKWRESFGFTETEKQQIEDYAVAENEPLADVLARHPEHIADTSKMVDACDIAFEKFMDEPYGGDHRDEIYSYIYRRAWSDALTWWEAYLRTLGKWKEGK